MLTNPKPKIASLREILLSQFVFLDLKTTLQDFFSFGTTNGDVNGYLLVTADTECSDGVAGFAWWSADVLAVGDCRLESFGNAMLLGRMRTVDGCLTTELLEHLSCTSESVAGFANGDVQDEFLDAELAHGIRTLVFLVRLSRYDVSTAYDVSGFMVFYHR